MAIAAATTIYTDTREYFRSHFKEPKGRGYWAFRIKGETKWFNGLYGEAKKQAHAAAREIGASAVTVLP